jgi:hypothetical protein
MPFSTSVVGVDASGAAQVYEPPNVIPVKTGFNVANGTYQQIQAGETWPPSPGVYQIGNGSGASTVTETVQFRTVTITPL